MKKVAIGGHTLPPEVRPGQSVELLQALHILTRDGALNHDARRKLKQVLHLVQLLRPSLDALLAEQPDPVIADLGTGKSYLGFILYDLVIGPLGHGSIFTVTLALQLLVLVAALLGAVIPLRPLLVARYYVLTTASIGAGLWDYLRHGTPAGWAPPEGTR